MKIGIVIDKLYPGKIGGAEQYVRNIISVMEKEENIELVLFLNEEAIGTFEKDNLERFHCVCVPNQISKPDSFFEYYIAKYGLQVLFCPLFYVPYESCSIPIVTSILDIQHEYYPEYFTPELLQYRQEETKKTLKNSVAIITISEFSKKTIIDKLGTDKEKIYVTYLDSDSSFGNKIDIEKKNEMKKRLPEHYIFYPANGWAHKNHKRLIDAYKILKDKYATRYKLVLTGNAFNEENGLKEYIQEKKLEEDIINLGYIEQEDMPFVFANAEMLVFPSLFEGFGIPLVEAMRTGTPIVCSDCGSIPEIAGDAAIIFDALDADDIAEKIHLLENHPELQEELRVKGYLRVKAFSWEKCARQTLDILRSYRVKTYGKRLLPGVTLLLPISSDEEKTKKLIKSIENQDYPNKKTIIFDKNMRLIHKVRKSLKDCSANVKVVGQKKLKRFLAVSPSDNRENIVGIIQAGQFFEDSRSLEQIVLETITGQEDVVWIMPQKKGFCGCFLATNIDNKRWQKWISYDKACNSLLFVRNDKRVLLDQVTCWVNGFYQEEIQGNLMREHISSRFVLMECIQDSNRLSDRKGRRYQKMLQNLWKKERYLSWALINPRDVDQRILVDNLIKKDFTSGEVRRYYEQIRNHEIEFDKILPDGWMSRYCELEIEIYRKGCSIEIIGNNLNVSTGMKLTIYIDGKELGKERIHLGEFRIKMEVPFEIEEGNHILRLEANRTFSYYNQTKRDILAYSVLVSKIFVNGMIVWER